MAVILLPPQRMKLVFPILCGLVMIWWCGCSDDAPPADRSLTPVTLQTEFLAVPAEAGFYHALVSGYYEEVGLDVTIKEGTGSDNPMLNVVSGQADFGSTSTVAVLRYRSQGMPLRALFAYHQHSPRALVLHAEDPADAWEDLDNRRILVTPGFPWIDFVERRYGISLNVAARPPSLAQFMADPERRTIQEVYVTNQPYFLAREGIPNKVLLIRETGYDPQKIVGARADFVRNNPKVAKAFMEATVRGFRDYFLRDPALANREMIQRNPALDPDLVRYYREVLIRDKYIFGDLTEETYGTIVRSRVVELAERLQDIGYLETRVDIDELVWDRSEN